MLHVWPCPLQCILNKAALRACIEWFRGHARLRDFPCMMHPHAGAGPHAPPPSPFSTACIRSGTILLTSSLPSPASPSEVDRGWSAGDCSGRYLEGHNDHIRCAQLEGSTLVTASGSMSHTDCSIR